MKKIFSKTAFSLLELIIASVLVVIVILGIFAINSVLSNNNQDYGQRYLVRSGTQATLNHILNNASLAIGSGTTINGSLDQGILIGAAMGDPDSLCIHQDIPPAPYGSYTIDNTPANNPTSTPPYYNNSYPSTTNDSRWLCYTWSPSTYQINYCSRPYYSVNPSYQGAANCNVSGLSAGPVYLGTAFSNPFAPATATFNPTSGFSMTIQNCLNNSATSTCFSASPDQVNNPQVALTGSVFPSQEGMQQN